MDEREAVERLVEMIDGLSSDNEEWGEERLRFMRKYGHIK